MLPHDYPPHHTVYSYFRQWGTKPFADQPSLLERLQQQLLEAEREADGREKERRC
jgi:transposase